MAADSAMDSLWFYQNILMFEPHVVGLQSLLTSPKIISPSKVTLLPMTSSSIQSSDESTKPPRLNIVAGQPLFRLPSSSSKRKPRARGPKSLSDKPGFTFPEDKPSPYMVSMVPTLRGRDGERDEHGKGRAVGPYLSEAWLVNNPPLPKSPQGADMKKHIRFWAKRVAELVHDDP